MAKRLTGYDRAHLLPLNGKIRFLKSRAPIMPQKQDIGALERYNELITLQVARRILPPPRLEEPRSEFE